MHKGFRRRSEVDRRLDHLVGNSGKLRETGLNSIVKMLRLFNLCDLTSSGGSGPSDVKVKSPCNSFELCSRLFDEWDLGLRNFL